MAQVGELPERFGRYRILKRLGQGGMGSVYLAEDTQLERKVALKVAHLGSEDDPEMIVRFRREARAAALIIPIFARFTTAARSTASII